MSTTPPNQQRKILFVAGFGDNRSMFDNLLSTDLVKHFSIEFIDLPGFAGGPALPNTTLETLADVVEKKVIEEGIDILVGHSIASVIVSIVANRNPKQINTVISMEGNLTDKDYFYTGLVEGTGAPEVFFQKLVGELKKEPDPKDVIDRYIKQLAKVDKTALYQLGIDCTKKENKEKPGKLLSDTPNAHCLYNRRNYKNESVEWLKQSSIVEIELKGATHWASIDQPKLVSDTILGIFGIDSM